MKIVKTILPLALVIATACNTNSNKETIDATLETGKDWPAYGGNKAGNRYSPLTQITAENVNQLQVAWSYDATERTPDRQDKAIQCQPIVVHGVLYGTTQQLSLFAVEGATGKELWRFTPPHHNSRFSSNRGVMYWENEKEKRILYSVGSNLYAIDATTGKQIMTFGGKGFADLHEGLDINLDHPVSDLAVTASSPGVIYKNTVVMGSSVSENGDAAPGHIRAFDVITGKLKWVFHTVPQPGEPGYETWPSDAYKKIGGANNWSGMVLDNKRGFVYLGTGSPAVDFYGGAREGSNLYSNCVLALDAETGKMKWYFQTIHHDLWDRDIPSPPNLTTITQNGVKKEVVVQATKDGLVYVLDRDKGTSLFPIEEKAVPTNGLPGEHPFATQQYPVKPLPFSPQIFTEADITNISPEAHEYVKNRMKEFGPTDSKFMPPSVAGTLLLGYSGGAEWGGNAIDPNGILYQNGNHDVWELKLESVQDRNKVLATMDFGVALYMKNCAACHGEDGKGNGGSFPSLRGIGKRKTEEQINAIIKSGSGRMPSFSQLKDMDRKVIVNLIMGNRRDEKANPSSEHAPDTARTTKDNFPYIPAYSTKVWRKFEDQDHYNANKPPWGTLNAIDLNTGDYLWTVPLGEIPELTKKGIPITGTENYGGPFVTASGLVFIAGTKDERIRAFDSKTGKVVWEYQLPAGGFATPITYEVGGKQYIVIAAGGGRGQKFGGSYIAFCLK